MASSIRSRCTAIAAATLSLALVAPLTTVLPRVADTVLPSAEAATPSSVFEPAGSAVGQRLTLKVNVLDTGAPSGTATSTVTAEQTETAAAVNTAASAPLAPITDEALFDERYDTENFWQQKEAAVPGLPLAKGDEVAPTTDSIFSWNLRNHEGTLMLIRPQAPTAFRAGNHDIPVKVTRADGTSFTTTLKVNVINLADRSWIDELPTLSERKPVDFTYGRSQNVPGYTLPSNFELSTPSGAPLGWSVKNEDGAIRVTAPATFTGETVVDQDIPINIKHDGTTVLRTLKIAATPPRSADPASIAGTILSIIASFIGSVLGSIVGVISLPSSVNVEIHDSHINNNRINNNFWGDIHHNVRGNLRDDQVEPR